MNSGLRYTSVQRANPKSLMGDKFDSGIGLRSTLAKGCPKMSMNGKCVGVDSGLESGHKMRNEDSQLRHTVPYTLFSLDSASVCTVLCGAVPTVRHPTSSLPMD
jgi:hypothetical protein